MSTDIDTTVQDNTPEAADEAHRGLARTLLDDFASLPGFHEIRTEDRPSLDKIVEYGKRGKYAPQEGTFRLAGRVYSWGAVAAHAGGYYALWITERPSRLFVASTLATVFTFTPAGSGFWTVVSHITELLAQLGH